MFKRAAKLLASTMLASTVLVGATDQALAQVAPAPDPARDIRAPANPPVPASASATPQDDGGGLSDIIVTAQRRSENAQNVPIAVATVDVDLAASLGVNNPEALGQLLPGVTFNRQGNGVTPFVRGIGTANATVGNEPAVALFVDDVYIPTSHASVFDLNSVESVTVLKGPQGTLFGRNATGGVIQVRTRDPSHTTQVDADLTYANYDRVTGAIYATTGLTTDIAVNIAAYGDKQHDGWGRNVITGQDAFKTEGYGLRGKVLWEGGASTRVVVGASYDRRKSDQGGFAQNIILGTFGTNRFSPTALGAGFYDSIADYGPPGFDTKAALVSVKIEHDFANATLRSITAYGDVVSDAKSDLETSPSPFLNAAFTQGSRTFTQELQLLSRAGSAVSWILGGFYMHDDSEYALAVSGTAFGTLSGTARSESQLNSLSGFGQVTAEILPKVNLTAGLRYTSDRRRYEASATLGAGRSGPFRDRASFDNLTGRASLDYHVSDDAMVYVAYNRGFKSGLFNLSAVSAGAVSAPPAVLPEELNAYTAGFKSELFDNRVRFNVEAYIYDYTNIQVNTVVAGATLITNAAGAQIKGFDADLTFQPVTNFTLSASLSYADGRYTAFPNGPQFFPLPPNTPIAIPPGCAATVPTYPVGAGTYAQRACDLSGRKTVQTAPLATTLTGSYAIPTSVGKFTLTGSWSHGGDYYFEPDNNAVTRQPKTDIVNASVSWWSAEGKFGISLFTNNLTGQRYYNTITQSSLGSVKYSPAPPQTYGVTLRTRL